MSAPSIASRADWRLHGTNADAVIQLLKARAGCPAPPPQSGRKLALLVEGGGMRGVCSAGGLVALGALGLRNAFDEIYATSAGAMNVAYFLADQTVFGIQIYYKEINNAKFISFRRVNKIVDIDFIFDRVVTDLRPLDTAKVLMTPSDFYIAVIEKEKAETVVLRAQDYRTEILPLLKATTALPVVYNRTVQVGPHRYIDGGLTGPVAIHEAIRNGCTDLLVFLTRPASYESPRPEWWERQMFSLLCSRGDRKLQSMFERSHDESNVCRQLCIGKLPPPKNVNIATFCPAESGTLISRFTTDATRLKQSAVEMAESTLREFGGSSDLIADLLQT